jgi:hypothetical protein
MGDIGEDEKYEFDLVKSNSDRMYGGFIGMDGYGKEKEKEGRGWEEGGSKKEGKEGDSKKEGKERKREDVLVEPVRSGGKPIPQSFIDRYVSLSPSSLCSRE